MEIVQYYISRTGKQIIKAKDQQVTISYKDFNSEYEYEYGYKELSPKVVRGKAIDQGWRNISFSIRRWKQWRQEYECFY